MSRTPQSIRNDKNMSEEEKLVRIAAKLGPSTQWSEDGKFINKISKLGRILKGDNYIDKRDLYNVVYDINKKTRKDRKQTAGTGPAVSFIRARSPVSGW